MKIAVTSTGKDMNAEIDPRFGRAAYFIIVDPDTMNYEVVDNANNMDVSQGAGIQAGKTVVDHKANVVITGSCGPKAFHVLSRAGINVITEVKGKVKDAILRYKNGELNAASGANVEGHWV